MGCWLACFLYAFQFLVSFGLSLTKPDVKTAVVNLLTLQYFVCCRRLKSNYYSNNDNDNENKNKNKNRTTTENNTNGDFHYEWTTKKNNNNGKHQKTNIMMLSASSIISGSRSMSVTNNSFNELRRSLPSILVDGYNWSKIFNNNNNRIEEEEKKEKRNS